MGEVELSRGVAASREAAGRLWFALERWPSFVDGFARLVERSGEWPQAGSQIVWESAPAGRGRVIELVVACAPASGQTVEFEDPRLQGTQQISFAEAEGEIEVTLSVEYSLRQGDSLLAKVVDGLFIRRAVRDSLGRTLTAFVRELEADAVELGG